MKNAGVCDAYVEVTNSQTGSVGCGWGQVDGCIESSCLDALNIAAHYATLDASCDDDSNCEVTYWAYKCPEFQKCSAGNLTSQAFDSLPNTKHGTKVPK